MHTVSAFVCATGLLNNTSLTRQSCDFKARRTLRNGGEGEVVVEETNKTKSGEKVREEVKDD